MRTGRAPARALRSAALCGALAVGLAGAVRAQAPSGAVEIRVTVGPGGAARVEERYALPPSPTPIELRLLARPCVEVGNVRVDLRDVGLVMTEAHEGPWTVLRNEAPRGDADSLDLTVGYDVQLTGSGTDVPLAYLTTPIPQRDGEREGSVHVLVRFGDGSSRVTFPHVDREGPAEWSARYVAIPSLLAVSLAGADRAAAGGCAGDGAAPGDDGGLVWRFLLLVGIMVAWVPIYLAWARRSEEGAR